MRSTHLLAVSALVAVTVLSSCKSSETVAQNETSSVTTTRHSNNEVTLPSGSTVDITLSTPLTSETASVGSAWTGSIRTASMHEGRNLIPVGSSVSGTVSGVTPAKKGDRAMLDLAMTSVSVNGHDYPIHGSMESVVAGSPRARNLGAIGAATVAGAVAGHAIGGNDKGTVIGAVVGGGTATAVVSQTKGYQVVLKEGTPITFTTNQAVAVRL